MSFAAVGIPGLSPGQAWVLRNAYDGSEFPPPLSGALVRDQFLNYGPTPTDSIPLAIRPSAGAAANTIQIGAAEQSDGLPSGAAGGFQMVVVDGVTGEVQDSEVAVTNPASESTVQAALGALGQSIHAGDQDVLLIASLGSAADEATQMPADWNALARFVQLHG